MTGSTSARTTALGEGVHQIRVPFPGPLDSTLVYAVQTDEGLVLVDAGWQSDQAWAGLVEGLAEIGHAPADVTGVVLTHFHPDHTGLCGRVREASGAWIAMHQADYEAFDHMTAERGSGWLDAQIDRFTAAGADAESLALIRAEGLGAPPVDRSSRPDRVLDDGARIGAGGRTLRAMWTPGHTAGHVCFALDETGMVFTGDHVLAKTTPHVGSFVYPLTEDDPLADFLASLRRIRDSGLVTAFGAHGTPIVDLPGRSDELIAHHEQRLIDLIDSFAPGEELTIWAAAARMRWYRPWSELPAMGRHMALSEGAAHLRLLLSRGVIEPVPQSDPVRYRLVPTPAGSAPGVATSR